VIDAGSSFVGRVQQNAVFKIVKERSVTDEGAAAGVQFDRIVKLGGKVSGAKLSQTVRIVKAIVKNEPTKSLKFPRKRVASKKTFRTSSDTHELLLVTDRFDLPAELVVLLYKYRWHIELFFKWLKCVMGCRHLVAESEDGVKMQVYAALIAGLLIVLWTGRKPTKADDKAAPSPPVVPVLRATATPTLRAPRPVPSESVTTVSVAPAPEACASTSAVRSASVTSFLASASAMAWRYSASSASPSRS